jgi:hypothetical protein
MKLHGLEMNGPIRSADGIDSIEIETGTGKVIINNALKLNFGTPPTVNYDKTLSADPSGGASWQTRSFVKNTVALFAMPSVPIGWNWNNTFTDGSMLVYQNQDGNLYSYGSDSYTSWTTAVDMVPYSWNSYHTHTYSGQSGTYSGNTNEYGDWLGGTSYRTHRHTYSDTTPTTDANSLHNHNIVQDTFIPKYNTVIAGTKAG